MLKYETACFEYLQYVKNIERFRSGIGALHQRRKLYLRIEIE